MNLRDEKNAGRCGMHQARCRRLQGVAEVLHEAEGGVDDQKLPASRTTITIMKPHKR